MTRSRARVCCASRVEEAARVAATVAERGVKRAAKWVAEARVVVAVVGETEVAMATAARLGARVAVPMV